MEMRRRSSSSPAQHLSTYARRRGHARTGSTTANPLRLWEQRRQLTGCKPRRVKRARWPCLSQERRKGKRIEVEHRRLSTSRRARQTMLGERIHFYRFMDAGREYEW